MLQRINRHRLGILILSLIFCLFTLSLLIEYDFFSDLFEPDEYEIPLVLNITIMVVIILSLSLLCFIASLLLFTFTKNLVWTFALIFFCSILISLIRWAVPPVRDVLAYDHNAISFLYPVFLWIIIEKALGSFYVSRRYKKDLEFNGSYLVKQPPEILWKALAPLPENQQTLFSTSISGVEPLDTDRHHYKLYTNNSGQQVPDVMVFTKYQKNTAFTTQSLHIDNYGNEIKITDSFRFVEKDGYTEVLISELSEGIPIEEWLYRKFLSVSGDYYDGFAAYYNDERDVSLRGAGRQKRAIEKN